MGRYFAQVVALGGLCGVLVGCPVVETPVISPIPPMAAGKVRVRVFTEPAPVRQVTSVGKLTFVVTDNELSRWDEFGVASSEIGVPTGAHVITMVAEPGRNQLWILSDLGLGHYDTVLDSYGELAPPPTSLGIDYALLAKEGASMAPSGDGGVWLGTTRGLFYASAQGGWTATPINESVRGLGRDRAGFLWIATRAGLLARKPTGETVRVSTNEGFAIVDARTVIELGERMLVIGTDEQGHERLAIGKQLNWVTYRALPAVRWDAAVGRGNSAVVMAGNRVYRISTDARTARPLARDTLRLVPLVGTPTVDWSIEPIDLALPAGPTALAVVDDQLLVGTRDLGVARYRPTDAHPYGWFRRKQMFEEATSLTVACTQPDDCWIATGAKQAWHWLGDRFVPGGPDRVVLAVVRDPAGPIYGLSRSDTEPVIHLSRIDGTSPWTPLSKIALATPGTDPQITFARFASTGALWVGLGYRDGLEHRPYGIAIVEPALGKVTYHRTEENIGDKKAAKMLPVPVGVVDADVRGDTAWFATNEGVARLANGRVKVWTEADGLRSELARAVTIAVSGDVIVATGSGAGVWDGKAWDFPSMLRFEINDVIATRNGQIWMGTERGIAAWDGKKVRRIDTRRGLAENAVLDVAVDQFDRVWARGPGSLTLISQ